ADRELVAVQGKRRNDDIDATAIRETGIDHRARLVDASANSTSNALSDIYDMLTIAELCCRLFQLAMSLDVDIERAIDQDVGDRLVLEQRFEWAEPDHIVGQLGRECRFLGFAKLNFFFRRNRADQEPDLRF